MDKACLYISQVLNRVIRRTYIMQVSYDAMSRDTTLGCPTFLIHCKFEPFLVVFGRYTSRGSSVNIVTRVGAGLPLKCGSISGKSKSKAIPVTGRGGL
jgi:hypothetical protein